MSFNKFIKIQRQTDAVVQTKIAEEAVVRSGAPELDWGVSGFERGKCHLFAGLNGTYKTTIALKLAGREQQMNDKRYAEMVAKGKISDEDQKHYEEEGKNWVVVFNSENSIPDPHAVDPETGEYTPAALKSQHRFKTVHGLDWQRVVLLRSNRIDRLFDAYVMQMLDRAEHHPFLVSSVVVDTWHGIQSETAHGKITSSPFKQGEGYDLKKNANEGADAAGKSFGGNAKTINPLIKFLAEFSRCTGATCYWTQMVMWDMSNPSYPTVKVLGGEQIQFWVSNIVILRSAGGKDAAVLEGDEMSKATKDLGSMGETKVGKKVYFQVTKARSNIEGRKGVICMNTNTGDFVDIENQLVNVALNNKVLIQEKASVIWPGASNPAFHEKTHLPKFKAELKNPNDRSAFDELYKQCLEASANFGTTKILAGIDAETDAELQIDTKMVLEQDTTKEKPATKKEKK